MSPTKTLSVALVEQLSGLLMMSAYLVIVQHILSTSIQHKPEESWINRARNWWLDEQLRAEKRKLHSWTLKETSTEPLPQEP